MARFGKGIKKDIVTQAKTFVQSKTELGKPRHGDQSGQLHSIRTSQERSRALVRAVTDIKQEYGIRQLSEITKDMAVAYLERRAEEVGQKSLDNERLALQMLAQDKFAMNGEKLERLKTEQGIKRFESGRAYTPKQVEMIAQAQQAHNALATRIAHAAGLRQHELYSLKPIGERSATKDRKWSDNRFTGREGVRYTVHGKGGLVREVMIPTALAEKLEQYRLEQPILKVDQGVAYQQNYGIGAGRSWAASFRSAAERSMGWHKGPHGVRHSYAQERMNELQKHGYTYNQSLAIVSQEMGHFRADITEVYLR